MIGGTATTTSSTFSALGGVFRHVDYWRIVYKHGLAWELQVGLNLAVEKGDSPEKFDVPLRILIGADDQQPFTFSRPN